MQLHGSHSSRIRLFSSADHGVRDLYRQSSFRRERAPTLISAHRTLKHARMNAELQGYTDSNGVSSTARPVSSQTSASAQNGETGSFEPSKRSGAAARLNMDDVVMMTSSEASFPPGLEGAAVPPGGESVALEGFPAQNLPEMAPRPMARALRGAGLESAYARSA